MPKGNLNALVGKKPSWASKTESRVSQADTKFANLLIDSLVLNPNNQNYNSRDEADKIPFEELVASIKLIGIRQPLDVEELDGKKYLIISGERRYKAAKEAGATLAAEAYRNIAANLSNPEALDELMTTQDIWAYELEIATAKFLLQHKDEILTQPATE